jgi:hypothetical protein
MDRLCGIEVSLAALQSAAVTGAAPNLLGGFTVAKKKAAKKAAKKKAAKKKK